MTETSIATTTLRAHCHCNRSTIAITLPTSTLPLPTHFCHCSICRHTHGTLCTIHAPVPTPSFTRDTFTAYKSSDRVTRYFCSTCGTHMLDFGVGGGDGEDQGKQGQWHVSASIVEGGEELWDFRKHIFLDDTRDGGLGTLIERINGNEIKRWNGRDEKSGEWALDHVKSFSEYQDRSSGNDTLVASCHCRGIVLHIARPPFPLPTALMDNSVTPNTPGKWYALHDVCTSCRLSTGCAIVPWCFPLKSSITMPDGSPYRPDLGTARTYQSSPGVIRTFCGVCGATATYATEERKEMVDVAVGLLEGHGVRAEDWLEWRKERVSFEKDSLWKGVVEGLKEGL